jgi:uncharacterized protein YceK
MKKILLLVLPVIVLSGCSQMTSSAVPKDSLIVVKDSEMVQLPAEEKNMSVPESSAPMQGESGGAIPTRPRPHGQRAKPHADTAEAAMNGEGSGTIPKPKPPRKQR